MSTHNTLESLKEEMTDVLQCMIIDGKLLNKLLNEGKEMSRQEFVDNLILERALHNDIVIRLNKFIDKRNDTSSLYNAIKELKKTKREKLKPALNDIQERLDFFVKTEFQELKKKRNEKLAHLKIGEKFSWDESEVIIDVVKILLKLIDDLSGEKVQYYWTYGKMEGKINLRQLVGLD